MASKRILCPAFSSTSADQTTQTLNYAESEYKHVLANISRSRYVAIATQPVHWLEIRQIVHN